MASQNNTGRQFDKQHAVTVVATARDRVHLRQVIRDLIASLDTKQTAKLHFWSHQLGHWWAPLRWFKTPPDANSIAAKRRHRCGNIAFISHWRASSLNP